MVQLIEVALALIVLHSPDGHEVEINPDQITSMREAREDEQNKLFTDKARCMINLADGKFVAVIEDCNVIREKVGVEQ